jgi:uncharacterized phiE125 gp8 family phage protein
MCDNRFLSSVKTTRADGYDVDSILTLDQVKNYLIVTHDEDNEVINQLLNAAIEKLESYCKRPFSESVVEMFMDVRNSTILFPRLPFISLTDVSIKVDRGYTGFEQLTSDEYEYFADELIVERIGTMYIKYKAGYASGELPDAIRNAILAEVAYRYENRGDKDLNPGICATAETYIAPFVVTSYI